MPRPPRENKDGGAYHVYARGNARGLVYRDDVDRRRYLDMLGRVSRKKSWICLSYCLMSNHLHLLIETPEGNLSSGMQDLQGAYAQAFNARHNRHGHVFQGRYGAVRIKSDRQLCAAAAYIARNPVEAGACQSPEQWIWSSYRDILDARGPNWLAGERLLSYFGNRSETARCNYALLSEALGYGVGLGGAAA